MADDYPYSLASDFAVNRILKEAPESFHKLDNDDVIQVYMDLFGTDPADDMGMNRGGMMNINRMTAPLGYALGGPAGMTEPERKDVEYARMMKEFEDSEGPGEPGIGYKLLQKITGEGTVDPIWKAKQFIKEKILRRTPGDEGSASGMNPLVEFQEMYDQYIIDGGELSFRDFFDMIQSELDKMAGE